MQVCGAKIKPAAGIYPDVIHSPDEIRTGAFFVLPKLTEPSTSYIQDEEFAE